MAKSNGVRAGGGTKSAQSWHPTHESFDLITSLLPPYTPLAEVLAVVGKKPVTIFSQARARTVNDLPCLVLRRHAASYRYGSASAEIAQRNFLHRSPGDETRYGPTMYDLSAAQVDAVMDISDARGDEVRTDRRFLRLCESAVLPSRQRALEVCRMGLSLVSNEAPEPPPLSRSDRVPQQHDDHS